MPPQLNKVELVGFCGSDFTHALSNLASNSKGLNEEKKLRISKRLKMLVEHEHYFIFKKSSLHFLASLDINSYIDLIKYRIGDIVTVDDGTNNKYYIPVDWCAKEKEFYIEHLESSLQKYHSTLERLIRDESMSQKRANESTRLYLPRGNQITADVTLDFHEFVRFLRLWYSVRAQLEIKNIAKQMLDLVADTGAFPETLEAFGLTINGDPRGPFL